MSTDILIGFPKAACRLVYALALSTIITIVFVTPQMNRLRIWGKIVKYGENDHRNITVMNVSTLKEKIKPTNVGNETVKLLTLATTFSRNFAKSYIYKNTVVNLALLAPHIQPVLYFTESNPLTRFAEGNGWETIPLERTHKLGLPFLKDIFIDLQRKHKSTFYGYVNGDILFDESLVRTLLGVTKYLKSISNILITGRRINYKMNREKITNLGEVKNMSLNGQLFTTDAEDYFITPYHGFPWNVLKDVVIGRPAFDNYVVAMGIRNNVTVIDATATVRALHQTGRDGNYAGHFRNPRVNRRIIGKFNYYKGLTTCAQWHTQRDVFGNVFCLKAKRRC